MLTSIPKYEKIKNLLGSDNPVDVMKHLSQLYTANEVKKLANEKGIDRLKTISTQILSAVDSFDIGECELLLSMFKD